MLLPLLLLLPLVASAQELPPHPRDIKYPELNYAPPKPADYRVVLSNGLRCYLVPDRKVPVVHVQAWIETGEVYVSKAKRGLAKLTGELMRSGGIEGLDARALDARLDAIAADIDVDFNLDGGGASLWTLAAHADEALDLFARVMTRPVFEPDRIRRAKDELKNEIAHRDDEPDKQLDHEVFAVLYGAEHPLALRDSAATVDGVTRDEIVAFHKAEVAPGATILAVSGDFERDAMVKRLETLFAAWKTPAQKHEPPAVERKPHPGVFLLDRDVNQGFVELSKIGIQAGDKDEIPLLVMNFIFGGGSFTSRITSRVRNDEGLAYSAGSYVHALPRYPGPLGVFYQSKAESTVFAAKICLEEVRKIRTAPVTKDEIEKAKSSLRDRFPDKFTTAKDTAAALAQSEFDGRPADWFETYRAKVGAVTAEDVLRVAKDHLDPGTLSIVVIGPGKVVGARDEEHKAALADFGKVSALQAD